MTTLILSASTLPGLRRAALKSVRAHLPEEEGMTETGIAESLGITRARLYALRKGRVEQFSLMLVTPAMRLGSRAHEHDAVPGRH